MVIISANVFCFFSIGRYHQSILHAISHLIFTIVIKIIKIFTTVPTLWMGKPVIRKVKQIVQGYPDREWSENPDPRSLQSLRSYEHVTTCVAGKGTPSRAREWALTLGNELSEEAHILTK